MGRTLDEYELALLDGLREGTSDAVADGRTSLDIDWRDAEDEEGASPIFVVRPSDRNALMTFWWMSANPNWRREDQTVAEFAFGDFSEGIVGKFGAPGRESLTQLAAQFVRALVEGRATYAVSKADPRNYDGPITAQALELSIRWRSPGERGALGGAVVRAHLADPEAFTAATGIPISAQVGDAHAFAMLQGPTSSGPLG